MQLVQRDTHVRGVIRCFLTWRSQRRSEGRLAGAGRLRCGGKSYFAAEHPQLLLPAWPCFCSLFAHEHSAPRPCKLLSHFLYPLLLHMQKCVAFSSLAHYSFHFLLTTASPCARVDRALLSGGEGGRRGEGVRRLITHHRWLSKAARE